MPHAAAIFSAHTQPQQASYGASQYSQPGEFGQYDGSAIVTQQPTAGRQAQYSVSQYNQEGAIGGSSAPLHPPPGPPPGQPIYSVSQYNQSQTSEYDSYLDPEHTYEYSTVEQAGAVAPSNRSRDGLVRDARGVIYRGDFDLDDAGGRHFELKDDRIECYRSAGEGRPEVGWPLRDCHVELAHGDRGHGLYMLVLTHFVSGAPTPARKIRGDQNTMTAWAHAISQLQEALSNPAPQSAPPPPPSDLYPAKKRAPNYAPPPPTAPRYVANPTIDGEYLTPVPVAGNVDLVRQTDDVGGIMLPPPPKPLNI